MNFSLHLQTIFTFVKTKQNNFKEKNPIHIYKNCTRHCLVMYLNSTTVDLFWLKGVLETVHAHIHISSSDKWPSIYTSVTTSFFFPI